MHTCGQSCLKDNLAFAMVSVYDRLKNISTVLGTTHSRSWIIQCHHSTTYKKLSQVTWLASSRSEVQAHVCRYVAPPWWMLLQFTTLYYVAIIFHRREWYRALYLRYVCIRSSGIVLIPRLPLCRISFLSRPSLLTYIAHGEKSRTQSLTHPACASEKSTKRCNAWLKNNVMPFIQFDRKSALMEDNSWLGLTGILQTA